LPRSGSTKPLAVVIGAVGKLPYAGMSLYFLHYVVGLRELGYEVQYVERLNKPNECYNPTFGSMSDNPDYAVDYLGEVFAFLGFDRHKFSFIDRENRCHGSG